MVAVADHWEVTVPWRLVTREAARPLQRVLLDVVYYYTGNVAWRTHQGGL
jgi:hypothetical protein